MHLALEFRRAIFDKCYQMKRQRAEAAKDVRRTTEILWRVDQDEPRLSDEGIFLSLGLRELRDKESLAFAEDRLTRLGFKRTIDANVRSYIQETDDFIVYADPRARGRIEFRVYSKKKKPRRLFGLLHTSFDLQDRWKNDLTGEYKAKLDEAVSRL